MKNNKKRRNLMVTILSIIMFLLGICIFLYPTVSNHLANMQYKKLITNYESKNKEIKTEVIDDEYEKAIKYNKSLIGEEVYDPFLPGSGYALPGNYNEVLNVNNDGIMGYIEIPILRVSLPIYHGTDEGVLQIAVGHLDWSSLPVGGESSSCVLCGHRGLPSSKLFTDLDKLEEGDIFMISVLNRVLTYEVDQIRIVEPDDIKDLEIVDGMDYCTLETCTPYAINTHRILVRGHRIENAVEARFVQVTADAVMIEPLLVAPALFVGLLLILLIVIAFTPRGGNRNEEDRYEEK